MVLKDLERTVADRMGDDGEVPMTVCFVCSGNTCRSPMAAAVLNYLGKGKYRAVSAGTCACDGDGITENAALALERMGIPSEGSHDYRNHRARSVRYSDMVHADMIIGMTSRHTLQLVSAFPEFAEKIRSMPCEVPDPFMHGETVYDKCLNMITDGIRELFALGDG